VKISRNGKWIDECDKDIEKVFKNFVFHKNFRVGGD
jgi:hypothetical protein